MLDWKILAASMIAITVALVLVADVFSGFGFLKDAADAVSDFFSSSPFGFLAQKKASRHVVMTLFSENLTVQPDDFVGIDAGAINMSGFRGSIRMEFGRGIALLSESSSKLSIKVQIGDVSISGLRIDKFSATGARFRIEPNMTTSNGTISFEGFMGSGLISQQGIELSGNVTKLTAKIGELKWEMG